MKTCKHVQYVLCTQELTCKHVKYVLCIQELSFPKQQLDISIMLFCFDYLYVVYNNKLGRQSSATVLL